MANISIYDLIRLYSNQYIFIWTQKTSAFWCMQKCNRIGVPFKLRNSTDDWNVFKLLHEIGHMKTHDNNQSKAQREFLATQWAINYSRNSNIVLDDNEKNIWQDYIYSFSKAKDEETKYKLDWDMKGE